MIWQLWRALTWSPALVPTFSKSNASNSLHSLQIQMLIWQTSGSLLMPILLNKVLQIDHFWSINMWHSGRAVAWRCQRSRFSPDQPSQAVHSKLYVCVKRILLTILFISLFDLILCPRVRNLCFVEQFTMFTIYYPIYAHHYFVNLCQVPLGLLHYR